MSSALFDKLQTEFAGAEVVARIAVNQTPADARAEWNSGLLIGAPDLLTAPDRRDLRLMGMRPVSTPWVRQEVEGQDVRD